MILVKVHIQNFKSFVDSKNVDIEPKLTILIGKNEQGKSNFLRALASFSENYKYLPSDLTSHLMPILELKPAEEVPMVTLWLKLDKGDLEELRSTIENIDSVKYLKVTKSYGNTYNFSVVKTDNNESAIEFTSPDITSQIEQFKTISNSLKAKLIAHTERSPEFAINKDKVEQLIGSFLNANFSETNQIDNLVKSFCTGIKGLPGQDSQTQADISAATKDLELVLTKIVQILTSDQVDKNKLALVLKRLPKFILHSTSLDKIPDGVNIAEFTAAPEKVSMGMLKLCRAAGLSLQKIQELAKTTNLAHVHVFEDYYKGYISGGLNEFWTQEKYDIHFAIYKDSLSVSITDHTYGVRLPPSQRSEGFQWYLSFYSTIQNESASSLSTIILLDNPALELHVDGQRDIKKFLEDKIATNAQIIYVTHSPAMVDPSKIEQIRTVELKEHEGSIISNKIIKEGEHVDILEPLRSAIGSSVAYSLLASVYNILVEGMADKFIIEGITQVYSPEISKSLLVNGSIAESKDSILADMYNKLRLPFVVVLDNDSSGREIAKRLRANGIEEKSILEIGKVFTDKSGEYSLADIFSEKIYHEAVIAEYVEDKIKIEKPSEKGSKIENIYEKEFKPKYGIEFSNTRVAKRLKKMLIEGIRMDKETETNLKKLANSISVTLTK